MLRVHPDTPLRSRIDVIHGQHVMTPWKTHLRPGRGDAFDSFESFVGMQCRVWEKDTSARQSKATLSSPPLVEL